MLLLLLLFWLLLLYFSKISNQCISNANWKCMRTRKKGEKKGRKACSIYRLLSILAVALYLTLWSHLINDLHFVLVFSRVLFDIQTYLFISSSTILQQTTIVTQAIHNHHPVSLFFSFLFFFFFSHLINHLI